MQDTNNLQSTDEENLSFSEIIDYIKLNEHIRCFIPSWERTYFERADPSTEDSIFIQKNNQTLNSILGFSEVFNDDLYYVFRSPDDTSRITFLQKSQERLLKSYFGEAKDIDKSKVHKVRVLKIIPENAEEGIITNFLNTILQKRWKNSPLFDTTSENVRFYTGGLMINYIEKVRNNELDEKSVFTLEKIISFQNKIYKEKNLKSGQEESIKYKIFFGLEPFLAYVLNKCLTEIKRCKNCSSFISHKFQNRSYCNSKICNAERAKNRKRKEYTNKKLDKEYIA